MTLQKARHFFCAHVFSFRLCNTTRHERCSWVSFRLTALCQRLVHLLCWSDPPPLTFTVFAARDRPDHERPRRGGGRPAPDPSHPAPSPTCFRHQSTLRKQHPQDQPLDGQQRDGQSGGRVPLQEVRQVSHRENVLPRVTGGASVWSTTQILSGKFCERSCPFGTRISKQKQVSGGV